MKVNVLGQLSAEQVVVGTFAAWWGHGGVEAELERRWWGAAPAASLLPEGEVGA